MGIWKDGSQTITSSIRYTVAYDNNTAAGTNTASVAVTIGNKQGTYTEKFKISQAALTIKASDQSITYGQSITQGTEQVTTTEFCDDDSLEGITLTANTANVPGGTITPSAVTAAAGM